MEEAWLPKMSCEPQPQPGIGETDQGAVLACLARLGTQGQSLRISGGAVTVSLK